jgi:hypothetical protein
MYPKINDPRAGAQAAIMEGKKKQTFGGGGHFDVASLSAIRNQVRNCIRNCIAALAKQEPQTIEDNHQITTIC